LLAIYLATARAVESDFQHGEETIVTTTLKASSCLAIFIPALCMTMPASADDAGFYLGARLGWAQYPTNSQLILSPDLNLRGRADDDEDLAWSIEAGYRFNRYVRIDAGYVDLGEVSSRLTNSMGTAAAQTRFAVQGATLALTGTYPLGNWEPYVKVGVFFFDTRLAFSGSAAGTSFEATVSGSATDSLDTLYGAGVGYNFSDHWQATLDLTNFSDAGESDTGQSDVLSLTAGVVWRF
jgi:lipopolysaccharide assembly outer membrane protein LptD (OstA)